MQLYSFMMKQSINATLLLAVLLQMQSREVFVSSFQILPRISRNVLSNKYVNHQKISPIKEEKSFSVDQDNMLQTSAPNNQKEVLNKVADITPLERVMLTREGNLQQLFSAYYDETVNVKVDRFDRMEESSFGALGKQCPTVHQSQILASWDREVTMSIMSHDFCKAISVVEAHSPEVVQLLDNQAIGIGQLFKKMELRPTFTLHDAGRNEDGGVWRLYSLHCNGLVTCNIREDFTPAASKWSLRDLK